MAKRSRRKQEDLRLKRIALLMASVCVRNTIIEDYHSRGYLSQDQMKAFNKEVSDKIYTFLKFFLSGSEEEAGVLLDSSMPLFPYDWDDPVLDGDILDAMKAYRKGEVDLEDEPGEEPFDPISDTVADVLEEKEDAH